MARSIAQVRQNVKPSTAQNVRIRCAQGSDCAWCGLPTSARPTRTGRGHADRTNAHVKPFAQVLTYAFPYIAPGCGTCNLDTKERDCTGEVAPGADWHAVSQASADAWKAAGHDPADDAASWEAAEAIDAATRRAARKARLGW